MTVFFLKSDLPDRLTTVYYILITAYCTDYYLLTTDYSKNADIANAIVSAFSSHKTGT